MGYDIGRIPVIHELARRLPKDRSLPSARKIVALVNNPATFDTRVIKEAEALAVQGYEVHVLCRHADGVPDAEQRNGVSYHRNAPPPMDHLAQVLRKAWRNEPVFGSSYRLALLALLPYAPAILLQSLRPLAGLRARVAQLRRAAPAPAAAPAGLAVPQVPGVAAPAASPQAALPKIKRRLAIAARAPLRLARQIVSRVVSAVVLFGARANNHAANRVVIPLVLADIFESVALETVIALRPDAIHAHDLDTLPTAVLAGRGLGVPVVYDAHELETDRNDRQGFWIRLLARRLEGQALRHVSSVVTVAPGIARHMAEEYAIPEPVVVFNSPPTAANAAPPAGGGLRSALGLSPQTPLVVYVGLVTIDRCLPEMVEALTRVPEFHLAMVGPRAEPVAVELRQRAARLGVSNRLHIVDPVAPHEVTAFVASADVGVIAARRLCLSYEYSMPNKLFEMSLAGLPLVVAELAAMRDYVLQNAIGVAVDSSSPDAIATGWKEVFEQRERYRPRGGKLDELRRRFGWEAQASKLAGVYAHLWGNA